jgi:hypothetical protein
MDGLEYYDACWCAGTGCGGHVKFIKLDINWSPTGWQGAAQHTYTRGCDGQHEPGACPPKTNPFTMFEGSSSA